MVKVDGLNEIDEVKSSPISPAFGQVMLDVNTTALEGRTFTYKIPEELRSETAIGTPVMVPFGRQPALLGYIVGFSEDPGGTFSVRDITDVLDNTPIFDAGYLGFLKWVADYYAASLYQVLHCALPSHILQKIRKEIALEEHAINPLVLETLDPFERRIISYLLSKKRAFTPKYLAGQLKVPLKKFNQSVIRLRNLGMIRVHSNVSQAPAPKRLKRIRLLKPEAETPKQRQLLSLLEDQGGIAFQKDIKASSGMLKKLVEQRAIVIEESEVIRDPLAYLASVGKIREYTLSKNQRQVVDAVMARNEPNEISQPLLLHGVTGSGKTEVYMSLTEETLTQGKSVLIMVPEIALTSQIARRFTERFGQENIALWHSNLSEGERADTWRRLARGDLKIIIGARSAVFAPLKNLGLIIMDEQHDASFKQESPAPRYHARTLAEERAKRFGARLVMGSATPDVADYYGARKEGRVLRLTERFGGRSLAHVQVVDMKRERNRGKSGILSQELQEALAHNLKAGEQSLVLINRRGFHTLIQCQDCNTVCHCPSCDVSLTYHRHENQVRCHHCGYTTVTPQFCNQCASSQIIQTGTGTQRVEEEIKKYFPEARLLRLDSDVSMKKDAFRQILDGFSAGEADILVGTQMVAKGLDIANVTLVGVINADSSFYLPDYRSSERGFQLLTQVAGRAGRGEKSGRVVFQSMDPAHPVMRFSKEQNYDSFFEYETLSRQNMLFPPFCQLFRIIVMGLDDIVAHQYVQALVEHLKHRISQASESIETLEKGEKTLDQSMLLLGPAPCVISRIQGQFRYHCLIKNNAGATGHRLITDFYQSLKTPEGMRIILDVDSQSLL